MKKTHLLTAGLVCLAAVASAQTRTVPGDHATVAAALAFFNPDPDALTANVIQITDSAVYDEVFEITVPVTIEGTGASRPVLTARINPAGDANDGLRVDVAGDVTLRNLIIIPSTTTPPTDDLVRTGPTGVNITLENVLITSNNGTNAPVSTDGLSPASMVGAVTNGDDGAFIAGTGTTAVLTNVVITHIQNASAGDDGIVCSAAAASFTINDGCVFSYNGRLGIQAAGSTSFVINAPTTRVKVIGNQGFAGIWFAGGQSTTRSLNGVDVLDNVSVTANQGWGIELQNGNPATPNVLSNAIISGNGGQGLIIGDTASIAPGTVTTNISNVTIARNVNGAISIPVGAAAPVAPAVAAIHTVNITDSILAGNGGASVTDNIRNDNVGSSVTISNSAVVLAGPQALNGSGIGGSVAITLTNVINADPMFLGTTDFTLSNFYDVGNSAYATAGTGSTPLTGGAQYDPLPPVSMASDTWSLLN